MTAFDHYAENQLAKVVRDIEPEGAYKTLAKAQRLEREGRSIIHLEIGEPDFQTPALVKQCGIKAIQADKTRYTPSAGITPLRESIARTASERLHQNLSAEQVVVGPGAKPLLFLPTLAIAQEGDEVIYPDPGFPTYEAMIRVAGATPVPIALDRDNGFNLPLEKLKQLITPRTRMIVINSPSNPTGGVLPQGQLEEIAKLAIENDCWVLSDEIYGQMVFDQRPHQSILSIESMKERTILVDGFSKSHAMTGWRLGYGIMPEYLARKVTLLMVHSIGCTAEFTQLAGLSALEACQQQTQAMCDAYQQRRDLVVARINQITGLQCRVPEGAFYAFPRITLEGRTSEQIADALLSEMGVALLPGTAFGSNGEGYLRICFANSLSNLNEAMDRMETWFQRQPCAV